MYRLYFVALLFATAICLPQHGGQAHAATATQQGAPFAHSLVDRMQTTIAFPANLGMDDVRAKYGAKGDGTTDDTAAIQRALNDGRTDQRDYFGLSKALYFPAGTYLIRHPLTWNGCCMTLQGQGAQASVLRLENGSGDFANPNAPHAVITTPAGNMSFRQNLFDLGIDVGRQNPGAMGIDYISNNTGTVSGVAITSEDGQGISGIDMTRAWPGPCLIEHVAITGFNYGIRVGQPEYGPTFEHITLQGQRVAGIINFGNSVAVRDVQSHNAVPALINQTSSGMVVLLDSALANGAGNTDAIINQGYLYARNITSSGYRSALRNNGTPVGGATITEYVAHAIFSLFPSPQHALASPSPRRPSHRSTPWPPGDASPPAGMAIPLPFSRSSIQVPARSTSPQGRIWWGSSP